MRLIVIFALVALAFAHEGRDVNDGRGDGHWNDVSGWYGEATKQITDTLAKIRQCRFCMKHDTKFCTKSTARPLASDYDGVCVSKSLACPEGMTALAAETDCANDAPSTKRSCISCMSDGYLWCPARTVPTDMTGYNIADEYDGKCIPKPADSHRDGSTGGVEPKPGSPDDGHDHRADDRKKPNPCVEDGHTGSPSQSAYPIGYIHSCPALFVQAKLHVCEANSRPTPPPWDPPQPPMRHSSQQSAFGLALTAVFMTLSVAVICYCCRRRHRMIMARRLAMAQAQAAASGVPMPMAQPVQQNPYVLPIPVQAQAPVQYQPYAPSHIAVAAEPQMQIQYPQVVQTAPVRASAGGPLVASNISFVPRDDIELGPVGSNGYARVAQNE